MKELIEKASKILAEKHGIEVSQLDYVGYAEMNWKAAGAVQVLFNINCIGHANHKSTVAMNSWNM